MLIGSRIIPKHSDRRNVDHFGTRYVFMNRAGDGHFTAEVKKQHHIDTLLANDAFYAYDTRPQLERPAPPAGSEVQTDPPKDTRTFEEIQADEQAEELARKAQEEADSKKLPGLGDYDADQIKEAKELLLNPPQAIGKKIGKVSSMVIVRCALLLEKEAKPEPRAFVVELLERAIEAAKQAGQG